MIMETDPTTDQKEHLLSPIYVQNIYLLLNINVKIMKQLK